MEGDGFMETDYLNDLHNLKYNACFVKRSPVKQYSKDGCFIKQYDSIKYSSKETVICYVSIVNCCQRKNKSAGGYKWLYADI